MGRPLTNKQKLFIEYYLADPNATTAARKAGYKGNKATLGAVGFENLKKPLIAAAVGERVENAVKSANEVLSELSRIAFTTEEKTVDRLKALDLLGKHHGIYQDNRANESDAELQRLRLILEARSKQTGVDYKTLVREFADNYAATVPSKIVERLVSELEM